MFVINTKGVALVYAILISPFFKITFYNQLCGVILLVIGEVSYILYNSNTLWGYPRVTTHIFVFIVYFHVGVLIPIQWFRFFETGKISVRELNSIQLRGLQGWPFIFGFISSFDIHAEILGSIMWFCFREIS